MLPRSFGFGSRLACSTPSGCGGFDPWRSRATVIVRARRPCRGGDRLEWLRTPRRVRFRTVAFLSSGSAEADHAKHRLAMPLRQHEPRAGGCDRRARRRRADAAGAAPLHGVEETDLRHEPRVRRLPDERIPGPEPVRSARGRGSLDRPSPGDARDELRRHHRHGAGDQRGVDAAPILSGGRSSAFRSMVGRGFPN